MDLTKEAIKYLAEQGINPAARLIELGTDQNFVIDNNGNAQELEPRVYTARSAIALNTLTGLVEYIKSNLERQKDKLILQVVNEREVSLKGLLQIDGSREELAVAQAIVPRFSFDHFYDTEEMNIALQSKFVINEHQTLLLKVIGNIAEKNVSEASDDGVSQAVTIKQGVASKVDVKVPNPVVLAPYRTFLEVEQPESKFIFRMQEGPRAAIFEADGGAWRNEAIRNIRDFMAKELKNELENQRITILA